MIAQKNQKVKYFLHTQFTSPEFTSRDIFKMMYPIILDSLSIMFINMLIVALISSSGEEAVAAVNLVNPLSTLIVCLLNGIAAGGTVTVTQCYGAGDMNKTRQAAGHILWLIILLGSAMSLLLVLFPRQILTFLYPTAEEAVLTKAIHYMSVGSISLIIFTVYTGIFCILRGLGEAQKCLWLTIIINVAYLLFSILFINILKMDIQGSALALVLARSLGSLSALALFFLPKDIPIWLNLKSIFSFRKDILHSIMRVSVPFGLEQIFLYGGNIVVSTILVPLGTNAVATNAIASSLLSVVTAAGMAGGNLGVTIVGRCVGAGDKKWAYRYCWQMNLLALILVILAGIVFYPLYPLMLKHLFHASEVTSAESIRMLWEILIPMLLFWPISNTMPYILRAASDTVFPSVLSALTMWAIRIGLGYLLAFPLNMGLNGLWISMWVEWLVRTAALLPRFLRKHWLDKAKVKPAEA